MRRRVKKKLTYQKGDNRGARLSFFVHKVVRHIFGILLQFTRPTGMLLVRKITLWWYGKCDPDCLYSTARKGMYFEQYIDGYILKFNIIS